jgi:23S rRNA (guanosine2251-2'-O)-methyltransferase
MAKNNNYWMCGKHSVVAALNNPNRKFYELLITQSCKEELSGVMQFTSKELGCNVHIVDSKQIEKLSGLGSATHQGIALMVAPLEPISLKDVMAKTAAKKQSVIIAMDNITDPQNFGAIIRSACAFNADAIVTTKNNSASESAALSKASVGTIEKLGICVEANLSNAFKALQKSGYWVIGLDGSAKDDIKLIKKYDKVVIVLGSEGEGMRSLVKENCDLLVKIPIANTDSLNVSNAAAIALYEANS